MPILIVSINKFLQSFAETFPEKNIPEMAKNQPLQL
jgi:hypothetical protein